jgi:hypothetical protein
MDRHVQVKRWLIEKTHRDTQACIFCGGSPTTKEHVFSQWTHALMRPKEKLRAQQFIAFQHPDRTDFTGGLRLPGSLRDWQIKCVCTTSCNNGWMREIENAAIPVMTPLIGGQQTILSPADQKSIATWAVLKAIVAHHNFIPRRKRKQFASKREPQAEWSLWIGYYPNHTPGPVWDSRPFPLGTNQREGPASPNCHATTLILNQLLIHVVNFAEKDFSLVFKGRDGSAPSGNIVPIWPPTNISVHWPPRPLTEQDVDVVSSSLYWAVQRAIARRQR